MQSSPENAERLPITAKFRADWGAATDRLLSVTELDEVPMRDKVIAVGTFAAQLGRDALIAISSLEELMMTQRVDTERELDKLRRALEEKKDRKGAHAS